MSEYSYEMPDEKALVHTAREYLRNSQFPPLADLLEGATCNISSSGSYSRQRWNCYSASITVYLPVQAFSRLDEMERSEIGEAFEKVFPKDVGYDVISVEFSPTLTEPFDVGAPSTALRQIIKDRNLTALDREFNRAIASVETDPPSAVTAACAVLESLFKIYIEDEGLTLPSKQTLKPLWAVVQAHLKLKPSNIFEDDINRILTGLTSITDGIASLRTHVGSAHGQGRKQYAIGNRHARLAIHSAHTLAIFIFETWDIRKL